MVDAMNEHVLQLEKEHQRVIEQGRNLQRTNLTIKNDKRSMLQALHALIECSKAIEMLAMEAKAESNKRLRVASETRDDVSEFDFMAISGLRVGDTHLNRETAEPSSETNAVKEKIKELEKSVKHVHDMLGATKGQPGNENLVVEMGSDIFKGEGDVQAWIEENLPSNHPFGVFVDVYVVLELILLGYTNSQAATMEGNQKLQLEADKAVVLKMFENKLPTIFGHSMMDGAA
eukprot:3334160-Ditylum_brightwellii.AAC.1